MGTNLDLKFDYMTHDLVVDNYDLAFVYGMDYVVQKLKIRLQFIKGEWYIDTTAGLAYFEDIWVKNPNLSTVDADIKATIIETPFVNSIISYSSIYDSTKRKLTVAFEVDTVFGIVSLKETL